MKLLDGKNLCNPGNFMRHKKNPTNKVTHSGILSLKNGVVWVGCPEPNCKTEIAIKKCDKHEFDTQKALNKEFPKFVPDVYEGVKCADGFLMYSEYVKGGSLKTYKGDPKLDKYVYKVMLALKIIHAKHPSFRHNDLHVDNILMKDDQPLLYDFEFANWRGNPMFDSVFKNDYGIYAGNHPMYDFHFFINSITTEFPGKFKTKAMSVFPPEYLVKDSPVVRDWRLRSDVKHTGLPTMDQVLRAFSPGNANSRRPKVFTLSNARVKKTRVNRSPPKKSTAGAATAKNREIIRNMKANILRKNNTVNNVAAELKAIRNYAKLPKKMKSPPPPGPRVLPPRPKRSLPITTSPLPAVSFTKTPRKRARIGSKLCTSYTKLELASLMKRLGHRVNAKTMTISSMCKILKTPPPALASAYKRPTTSPTVNVRKSAYEKHLRNKLYKLAKNVGVKVLSKDKKGEIILKIRSKLNKNIADALKNASITTARQVSEKLAKNYGWKNNRHVERVRVLKIYGNTK